MPHPHHSLITAACCEIGQGLEPQSLSLQGMELSLQCQRGSVRVHVGRQWHCLSSDPQPHIPAALCQPAKAIILSKTWSFLSVSSVLNLFNALPSFTVGQMEISTGTGPGAGRREPGTSADVDLRISLQSCFYLLLPSPCKSSVLRHRAGMNSRRWERGIYCPGNAASRTILSGCSLSLGVPSLKGRAGARTNGCELTVSAFRLEIGEGVTAFSHGETADSDPA